MAGHDETNIVLLEVVGEEYVYSDAGFAGIGPLIIVVDDADVETRFYTEVLGLDLLLQDILGGPDIERVVGLPAGAGIDFRVLGDADDPMGRIEVIEYQQVSGTDRMARARPPATGFLHVVWQANNLADVRHSLREAGVQSTIHTHKSLIYGTGTVVQFTTPEGFHIEVIQGPASPKR